MGATTNPEPRWHLVRAGLAFLTRWLLRGIAAAAFVGAVYVSYVEHDDERASRLLIGGGIALAVGLTVERRPFRRPGGRRPGRRPPRRHPPERPGWRHDSCWSGSGWRR